MAQAESKTGRLRLEWHGPGLENARLFDPVTGVEYDFHDVSILAGQKNNPPEIFVRLCAVECDIRPEAPEKSKTTQRKPVKTRKKPKPNEHR